MRWKGYRGGGWRGMQVSVLVPDIHCLCKLSYIRCKPEAAASMVMLWQQTQRRCTGGKPPQGSFSPTGGIARLPAAVLTP